jgi:hypothetical protein
MVSHDEDETGCHTQLSTPGHQRRWTANEKSSLVWMISYRGTCRHKLTYDTHSCFGVFILGHAPPTRQSTQTKRETTEPIVVRRLVVDHAVGAATRPGLHFAGTRIHRKLQDVPGTYGATRRSSILDRPVNDNERAIAAMESSPLLRPARRALRSRLPIGMAMVLVTIIEAGAATCLTGLSGWTV